MIDRRTMLGALAGASLMSFKGSASGTDSDLRFWLARHVVPIRTIDPNENDFSDLEPLTDAIGTARVVQLGEPSHGAGSSFSAKARLIKFLHARMGFDVVAWESGFYDVPNVQAALRAGENPVVAAQQGILRIWSASQECRPLFDYAQATLTTPRPLEMAGFDMQFTADGSAGRFASDLRSFARLADATDLAEQSIAVFDRLNGYSLARARRVAELSRAGQTGAARNEAMASWEAEYGRTLRPVPGDLVRLERSVGELRNLVSAHRALLASRLGGRRASFMGQTLNNLIGFGANLLDWHRADGASTGGGPSVESENRRDALNADNIRWLMDEGFPGRKLIIWAHNAHVMNAYYGPDWSSVSLDPRPGWMKPTGAFLAERLGQDLYTIGITTFAGEDGFAAPMPPTVVPPASPGSIEAELHELGHTCAFIDFGGTQGVADNPLRQPQRVRIPKYEEELIHDVTRPYDAILFIDRMARANRLQGD